MDLSPITTAVVDIIEEVVKDVAPSDLGIVTFFCNEAEKIEKVVEDIINKEPIPVQPPTSPVLTENLYPFSPNNKKVAFSISFRLLFYVSTTIHYSGSGVYRLPAV